MIPIGELMKIGSFIAAFIFNPLSYCFYRVIYGYEKQSNDLYLVDSGNGGYDELVNTLDACRILYAFLRIKDPNTDLLKVVLINWVNIFLFEFQNDLIMNSSICF